MKFFPQQTSFDNRDKSNAGIRAFRKSGLLLTVSFVREFLQNALDAILKKDQPVRLKFKIIEITKDKDKQYLKGIYKEAVSLLGQSGTSKKDTGKFLVIEEFNTSGLIGTSEFEPKPEERELAHWSNFSFGMFRESKRDDAAGRNGVGKIMLNLLSGLRLVMYKTHRYDDDKVWLGGRVEYETSPKLDSPDNKERHYQNWGWLSSSIPAKYDPSDEDHRNEVYKPTTDSKILKRFDQIFGIGRSPNEYGTSWIIPSPINEKKVKKEVERSPMNDLENIIDIAITEFTWAFISGQLEIDFDGFDVVHQGNIQEKLNERYPDRSDFWEFLGDVVLFDAKDMIPIEPTWQKKKEITNEHLTTTTLEDLKKKFQDTESTPLAFSVPIVVHKKKKEGVRRAGNKINTTLNVFLKKPSLEIAKRREVLFVRSSLVLSDVKSLDKVQKAFCVIHVEDKDLSSFCANAENEDHTNLDPYKYQLEQKYTNRPQTISAIRAAAKVIFEALESYNVEEFDQMIAEMFGVITPKAKPTKKKKRKKKPGGTPKPRQISRDYFQHENDSAFVLEPGSDKLYSGTWPLVVKVILKTESFMKGVQALDVSEIGFSNSNVVKSSNCSIKNKGTDYIEVEIDKPDFYLEMDPFSARFQTTISYHYDNA